MKISKNTFGYLIIVAALIASAFFSLNLYLSLKTAHDKLDVSRFPYKMGEWQGKDLTITEKEYAILETRNLILREYTDPSGQKIFVFIIYSETNRAVFHPPEVCLIGSGVEIVDKKTEEVRYDKYAFLTNKLYLKKGNSAELVLYCYKAGSFYTDNFYLQQTYLAFHQIFGHLIPGATIRLSMPMNGEEKKVIAPLKSFLKDTIATLDRLS